MSKKTSYLERLKAAEKAVEESEAVLSDFRKQHEAVYRQERELKALHKKERGHLQNLVSGLVKNVCRCGRKWWSSRDGSMDGITDLELVGFGFEQSLLVQYGWNHEHTGCDKCISY